MALVLVMVMVLALVLLIKVVERCTWGALIISRDRTHSCASIRACVRASVRSCAFICGALWKACARRRYSCAMRKVISRRRCSCVYRAVGRSPPIVALQVGVDAARCLTPDAFHKLVPSEHKCGEGRFYLSLAVVDHCQRVRWPLQVRGGVNGLPTPWVPFPEPLSRARRRAARSAQS